MRTVGRAVFPFLVVGALWELVARSGLFHARLFPRLEEVASAFVRLTADGILPHHARWASFLSRLTYVVVDELHVAAARCG